MSSQPDTFSPGSANLLQALRFYKTTSRVVFPQGYVRVGADSTKTTHDWFLECINQIKTAQNLTDEADAIAACQIEENMGIFGIVGGSQDRLMYANLQAVIVHDGDLTSFYLGAAKSAQYLRLDYDLEALGPLFKEAAPHVHIRPDGEPRFACCVHQNIVAEFVDFIYRNYFHDVWVKWARRVWEKQASSSADNEVFDRIVNAFNRADIEALVAEKSTLDRMKSCWQRAVDSMYTTHAAVEHREALALRRP